MAHFKIGSVTVGEGFAPFLIAEAGINHNGDLATAKQMIDVASEINVDAVKFQTFKTEDFLTDKELTYTYTTQGHEVTESMFEMFKRTEFSEAEWKELKDHCDKRNISFLSTPVTVENLQMLVGLGVGAVKVGSDDFTNIPLIKDYANFGLPLLLSCGMADGEEIEQTYNAVRGSDVCLLLCTSQYPTPPKDVNAKRLHEMASRFPDVVLGFSDHTEGFAAAVLAVAYGARVFEKHFTLSHEMAGPDHWFSAEPEELAAWALAIRESYDMLGDGQLEPTLKEREMRILARRSIVALRSIPAGDTCTLKNIGLRRPGNGIEPHYFEEVIGRRTNRDLSEGELLTWEALE